MCNSGAIPAYNPNTNESLQLYIGIIDVLQSYRFAKKFEHTFKSLVHDSVRVACSLFDSLVVTVRGYFSVFTAVLCIFMSLIIVIVMVKSNVTVYGADIITVTITQVHTVRLMNTESTPGVQ